MSRFGLFVLVALFAAASAGCAQSISVRERPDRPASSRRDAAAAATDTGPEADGGLGADSGHAPVDAASPVDVGLPADAGLPADTGQPAPDAASPVDAGTPPTDSGVAHDAGHEADAGFLPRDSGVGPCQGLPYCLLQVTAVPSVVDAREAAALEPVVVNPSGVALTYRVDVAQVTTQRASGRPELDMRDVTFDFVATPTGGSFQVTEVWPWFMETTFRLRLYAKGPGAGDPEVFADVSVLVRGNVVIANGSGGKVHAVASDGLPATGGGAHQNGQLISQLVHSPRAMRLLSDGSLLVYDDGIAPKRLLRFEMSGADIRLQEFDHTDAMGASIIRTGAEMVYGLTELPDGRIVLPEYKWAGPSGQPKSRILVWNADGTFDRRISAPTPAERWLGVEVGPGSTVLLVDRDGQQVTEYDTTTWTPTGTFVGNLTGDPVTIRAADGGDYYIGGYGFVLQVTPGGGQAAVSGLAPSTSMSYRAIVPYEGGRVLAAKATQVSSGNVALIEGRRFSRWFRAENAGPPLNPYGIEYLR